MTSLENHLKELTDNAEIYRQRSRQRAILLSLVIPAVLLSLYLGFAVWQVRVVEIRIQERNEVLNQKDKAIKQRTAKLEKLQAKLNDLASLPPRLALAQLNELHTNTKNVRQLERDGFRQILDGQFEAARSSFGQAYTAYPIYHNVDEIYHQVLTPEQIRSYNSTDSIEKQAMQCEIMQVIIQNYSWGMPEDLQKEMSSKVVTCNSQELLQS